MLKMNKLLLVILVFFFMIGFSNAVTIPPGGVSYWNFSNVNDLWNGNNGVNNGASSDTVFPTFNASGSSGPNSFDFVPNDFIEMGSDSSLDIVTDQIGISVWFKADVVSSDRRILSFPKDEAAGTIKYSITLTTSNRLQGILSTSSGLIASTTSFSNTSNWHNVILTYNGANQLFYLDGVLVDNDTQTGNIDATVDGSLKIGKFGDSFIQAFDGHIDEVKIYNKFLNSTEIFQIYNYGKINFTEPLPSNESIESTIFSESLGAVTINSTSFVTILSNLFEVTLNNTPVYFSYVANFLSTINNTATCKININDTFINDDFDSLTIRDNIENVIGSKYITTANATLPIGNYTSSLECNVDNGSYLVGLVVGIGHFLIDENDDFINHEVKRFTGLTNTTTFQKIQSYNFTINDTSIEDNITQNFVIEWSCNCKNNAGITETLNTYINISGNICPAYPRSVTSGETSSISGDCLLKNVTPSSVLDIDIYALGSNASFNMTIHNKNFYNHISEINKGDINNIDVNSSSLTNLKTINITNFNHENNDLFIKTSIPFNSSTSTLGSFRYFVNNGTVNYTSPTFFRSANTGNGVLNIHYLIQNLGLGIYNITLQGACGNSDCKINGGEIISYITSDIVSSFSGFNISVFDNFDNSTIIGFNVTLDDGTTYSINDSNNQIIFIPFGTNFINFTINSNYNGGYFSERVLNHNVNNSYDSFLNQTYINWACFEKISNNSLTCSSPSSSTIFNYNVLNNPHNQSINVSGYLENIIDFNVSALQNNTLNATNFYSTNQTFTVTSLINGSNPSNCTYNVSSKNYSFLESKSTITANITDGFGLINGTYNVTVDCSGFSIQTIDFVVENVSQNLNINLYTTNSINLTFYDSNTGTIMNGTNITVQFIGSTSQTNNTITGSLYVDLFNPDSYTILFEATNYRQGSYIFTLDDRENIQIPLYMELINETDLVLISVIEKYSKDPIQNAIVTIQKYRDDAWVTDQIVSTDFQGFTEAYFILSTQFYNFVVEFEDQIFFGVINSNINKKTIFAEDVANGISIEIDTSRSNTIPIYQTSYDIIADVRYNNVTNSSGFFIFYFDDTNNLPRNAVLNVTQDDVVVCTNSVVSESGNLNCAVNVTLGNVELFTGTGFVKLGNDWIPLDVHSVWVGVDETITFDWVSTGLGYILSFFIVLIAFLLFAKIPSMSVLSGTIAFVLLIFFRVLFNGLNLGLLTGFLFAAYLLSRIPSKSGVNA